MPVMATSQSVEMEPVNDAVQKSCAFTVGWSYRNGWHGIFVIQHCVVVHLLNATFNEIPSQHVQ